MPSTIPPELLSAICAQVSSKNDLKSLVLCSKQLNDLATPHLYRNLDLEVPESDMPHLSSEPVHYLQKILLLLIRKPKLAAHVRTFSYRPTLDSAPFEDTTPTVLSAEIQDAIRLLSLTQAEEESWIHDAARHDADTLTAILISRLVRLEALDLEIADGEPPRVSLVLKLIGQGQPPFTAFRHLRSVLWRGYREKYGVSASASAFLIPSVKEIYMYRIGTMSGDAGPPDGYLSALEAKSSNVEMIQLNDSRLLPSELFLILAAPRHLKTFIYEVGWGHLSYEEFSIPDVVRALQAHTDTLEYLCLDHSFARFYHEMDDVLLPPLQHFTKLHSLRIAAIYVLATFYDDGEERTTLNRSEQKEALYKLLPAQLETLHLTHADEEMHSEEENFVIQALMYLLEHNQRDPHNTFPCLKEITLDLSLAKANEHLSALTQLFQLAKDAQITMKFLRANDEDGNPTVEKEWGWDEDVIWRKGSNYGNERLPRATLEFDKEGRFCEMPDLTDPYYRNTP